MPVLRCSCNTSKGISGDRDTRQAKVTILYEVQTEIYVGEIVQSLRVRMY